MKIKEIVVVTGLSGSGKSTAINILEDLDYFAIDNMPMEIGGSILGVNHEKVAISIDIRSFSKTEEFFKVTNFIKSKNIKYKILFLEATDEVIIHRYNLTRRMHPLKMPTLLKSIHKEKEIMSDIKEIADEIIDTSHTNTAKLISRIEDFLRVDHNIKMLNIHIQSFGYKYGIPLDSDLLFDVRFLPNPYYVLDLKNKTGNDIAVREYVMDSDISKEFYERMLDFIKFLLPNYITEGKRHLTIGIGCSGGKHRSVTISNFLYQDLSKDDKLRVYINHREKELGNW